MKSVQERNGVKSWYATTITARGGRPTDLKKCLEDNLDGTDTRVNLGTGVWALPHYADGVASFDLYSNRRTDTRYFEEGLGRLLVYLVKTGYTVTHQADPAKERAHLDF